MYRSKLIIQTKCKKIDKLLTHLETLNRLLVCIDTPINDDVNADIKKNSIIFIVSLHIGYILLFAMYESIDFSSYEVNRPISYNVPVKVKSGCSTLLN